MAKKLPVKSGIKVAFPGELGSFSHHASRKILGSRIGPFSCRAFEDVFEAVARKKAEIAVIPIENTLAGSIYKNYDLLAQYSLEVIAETSLRVEHNLIVHPGVSLKQIRQVYSHPAALEQCAQFLRRFCDYHR